MYNQKDSYLNLVTKHIELDKLLFDLPKDKQIVVKKLLEKRDSIRASNGLFAEFRINQINKKISKIKRKNC